VYSSYKDKGHQLISLEEENKSFDILALYCIIRGVRRKKMIKHSNFCLGGVTYAQSHPKNTEAEKSFNPATGGKFA